MWWSEHHINMLERLCICPLACSHPFTTLRSKGLTLIELVVVMTLLVLLAFIATPSFVSVTKSSQVRTAAQQIVAVLKYARAKALSLGRPALVSIDREQNTISVLLPIEVIERRLTTNLQTITSSLSIELTDEDWWKLSGERIETLDPEQFAVDPSPMGRERKLSEGVEVSSIQDLESGEEVNMIAFYPDGTASGASVVVSNDRLAIILEIAPLTGSIQLRELSNQEMAELQR